MIYLKETPSTGYEWHVNGIAANYLWKTKEKYTLLKKAGADLEGLPGVKKITLTASADKNGTATFQAALVRDWRFEGFENFKEENHRAENLAIFDIRVGGKTVDLDEL